MIHDPQTSTINTHIDVYDDNRINTYFHVYDDNRINTKKESVIGAVAKVTVALD